MLFIVQSPYLSTIGHRVVFSLARWAGQLRTRFHESRATLVRLSTGTCRFRIRDYHPLWCDFPDASAIDGFVTPQGARTPGTNPGLGYVRFRSPLLTESMSVSFPPGTKMFQFPGFAPYGLYIQPQVTGSNPSRVSAFRNLRIKASLPTPRSFSQATTSFFASRCQDIHHTPLVA